MKEGHLTIRESGEWSFCSARIKYESDSHVLEACDPYGCSTIEVRPPLIVLPAPPILRPFSITQVVYIDFARRVFLEKGASVWAAVPLDIEIIKKGRSIVRLASNKAKYRLVGSLTEGVIARNAPSQIAWRPEDISADCTARVRVRIDKGADAVEGIPFNAAGATIFKDRRGDLYLSLVTASISHILIDTRTTRDPPLPGLEPVRGPPYGQHGRVMSLTQTAVSVERGWRLWPYLRSAG